MQAVKLLLDRVKVQMMARTCSSCKYSKERREQRREISETLSSHSESRESAAVSTFPSPSLLISQGLVLYRVKL